MQSLTKAPRAALMQDLSGLGRCALSVALSVLGAMGVQGCALPTAVLSTHTGGFGEVAIERMSDMLSRTLDHYQRLNARFEAVYIGYLASNDQAALAKRLGITRSSVNAWELGLNVPSTQYIIELSEIFKVSTDYLLCVAKTQTLDLTGLDEEDIAVLYALATHLRRKNREMKL